VPDEVAGRFSNTLARIAVYIFSIKFHITSTLNNSITGKSFYSFILRSPPVLVFKQKWQ
jgi:hypothetical protein